jgi:hypothetical protein
MSYIILIVHCCHIIVPNVHVPTQDKIGNMKGSFYEEPECAFDKFPTYHKKILLADFNAKVVRDDIFNPTIRNENLQEISNYNAVRAVNSATHRNLSQKYIVPTS